MLALNGGKLWRWYDIVLGVSEAAVEWGDVMEEGGCGDYKGSQVLNMLEKIPTHLTDIIWHSTPQTFVSVSPPFWAGSLQATIKENKC